MHTITYFFRC